MSYDISQAKKTIILDANGNQITGFATSAKQTSLLTELQAKTEPANTQKTEEQETTPVDGSKNNPSLALSYDGSGNLTTITKTIGVVNYQKTLTYDVDDNLETVSVWSAV